MDHWSSASTDPAGDPIRRVDENRPMKPLVALFLGIVLIVSVIVGVFTLGLRSAARIG
jgi:hypothetical protein